MTFRFVPSSFVKFSNFCADPLFVEKSLERSSPRLHLARAFVRRNLRSNQICIGALMETDLREN